MFKPRRLAFVAALVAVSSSLFGTGSAFAYPSSYQNSWGFLSQNDVSCTWSVNDRAYASAVYPAYDQVKVTQSVSCSAPIATIQLSQNTSSFVDSGDELEDNVRDIVNGYVEYTQNLVSNTVTGGSTETHKVCYSASSCNVTATWDRVPPGEDVAIDPQDAKLTLHCSAPSCGTDRWISSPCEPTPGGNLVWCSAPITLTTP